MRNPQLSPLDLWLHRYWSPDPAALERLSTGRPAVVITGASEGIGLALADRFAAAGWPVLLIARGEAAITTAAAGVAQRYGVDAVPLTLDITAPDAAEQIAAALTRHGLYCDVLVNNAGIGLSGPYANHEPQAVARLIDTNVRALSLLMRRFLPDMCIRGRGGMLNVASLGGYAPGPNQAAYYASKAYVISLTRAVAWETRGLGLRIAVLSPGPVDTRFHAKMGTDTALYRYLLRGSSAEQVARAGYQGWRWHCRVILPGLFTPILALVMTLTPGILSIPIIGLLLRRPHSGPANRPKAGEDARRS